MSYHAGNGWITCEARRGGGAVLRCARRGHAGVPHGGARAVPLRTVHPGAAEPVPRGGARMRRGAAGARLRMLPRLRAEARGDVRDLHGAVRLRTQVHPKTRRPPAAALPDPRTGRVRGGDRAGAHPGAPDAR